MSFNTVPSFRERWGKIKVFTDYAERFGAVIIVDFYIDDFIFASFIFMKEAKLLIALVAD